jgi:hypothetical protein
MGDFSLHGGFLVCGDDSILFQMMACPTYHTIHLSTSCIVMMYVGRDRVGFFFLLFSPGDRDGGSQARIVPRRSWPEKQVRCIGQHCQLYLPFTLTRYQQQQIYFHPLHHILHLHRPTRVPRRHVAHSSHWAHRKPSIVLTFARYQKSQFSKRTTKLASAPVH